MRHHCARPQPSTQDSVHHARVRQVNPDASLSAGATGSNVDVPHAGTGLAESFDNAAQPPVAIVAGRVGNTADRSRYCRDHSGGRSPPDNDIRHSCIYGHCSPSASPADENWIERPDRAILILGPCLARAGGAAADYRLAGQDRCRTCLNGPDGLTNYSSFVTFARYCDAPCSLAPLLFPLRPVVHHPRRLYFAVLTNYGLVSTAIYSQ